MRRIIAALIMTLFFSDIASGANLGELTRIQDIKLLSNAEEIRVLIKTEGNAVLLPSLTFVNDRLIQLDIDRSYTEPARRSFSIGDSYLDRVEIYQLDEQIARVRLHLLQPLNKEGSRTWHDEKGFLISLKRSPDLIAGQGRKSEVAIPANRNVEIEKSFPTLFNDAKEDAGETDMTSPTGNGNIGLAPVIKMVSSLALVIGLFLLGTYVYKNKFLRSGPSGKGDLIRVLDRGFIDVKKGIVIVDVAGEVLVLGIAGETISMLTKLESGEALERLKPFYRKKEQPSFPDSVRMATSRLNEEPALSIVEKIRRLKPLK